MVFNPIAFDAGLTKNTEKIGQFYYLQKLQTRHLIKKTRGKIEQLK